MREARGKKLRVFVFKGYLRNKITLVELWLEASITGQNNNMLIIFY